MNRAAKGAEMPANLSAGLDLFAAAWLERWQGEGGTLHLEPGGRLSFTIPEYWCSPAFVEPDDSLPGELATRQREWHDANYHGRMNSMLDMLKGLPMGMEALKAHLRGHGI